jgi:hypothetical protein
MRRWLSRLAFPCLVLAFALAWEGRRISTGRAPGVPESRATVYYLGAAALFGVGLAGVRERHRRE